MAAAVGAASGADVPSKLKLYSYFRSSCSFRVRIALNLKGLEYEYVPVNLLKGAQFGAEFSKVNPINHVPALADGDFVISDSFAILMYLEEKYPQHHPLLPSDLRKRAINYQAANIVSSSIQPFQNTYVMKFIEEKVGPSEPLAWIQYHIGRGFSALENVLADHAGKYATGDEVCLYNLVLSSGRLAVYAANGPRSKVPLVPKGKCVAHADVFLAPQIYAAVKWFNVDMSQYPILSKLHEAYNEIPAFQDAMPENQPDAPQPQA